MPILTHFDIAPKLLPLLQECLENYGVGDDAAEWPNNLISRHAALYANGTIARQGETPHFEVDSEELKLVQRLSREAAAIMAQVPVGMGSEAEDFYQPFFIAANVNEPAPETITEKWLRAKFGGTIFPPAPILIEPLEMSGKWWQEVNDYYDEAFEDEDYEEEVNGLEKYQELVAWFQNQPEILNPVFICIGDYSAMCRLDKSTYPPSTAMPGSVLPRIVVGLTKSGSLVGVFGVSVQT